MMEYVRFAFVFAAMAATWCAFGADGWRLFDRRLGLFVHWGIYSVGEWHEQEQKRRGVSRAEYAKYAKRFTAERFSADAFVDAAESLGADYIVFTAKHHDGFCMWDTKTTDFSVMNTPAKRDVLKELSEACARRGMKLGLYYSNPDWHHPNAYNPRSTHQIPPDVGDEPDIEKYADYVKAQVTELLTNYGEIVCLFWDIPTHVERPEMNELVRRLQPRIKINNRGWGEAGDYSTPERGKRDGGIAGARYVEACNSVGAQSWGYRRNEDYRTLGYLTRSIDKTLSTGGNYLLNVGPEADGTIPDEALGLLRRVGAWHAKVRESYSGVETVTNLVRDALVTRRGDVLYLHYPDGMTATGLDLAPLSRLPRLAKVLNDGTEPSCEVVCMPNFKNGGKPSLHLSDIRADGLANESVVIRLEVGAQHAP